MHQAKQDPGGQPMLASPSLDPPRLVPEAARNDSTAVNDEARSPDRAVWFTSGSGVELQYPARLVWPAPWVGHIPFAFWLVEALRPRIVVELGVHSGNSYCAFLQAVQSLALPAQCYGIDHWQGDEHSAYYGDEVYAELGAYHDPLYGSFSTLIRAPFEAALPYFSDRSVDLLHIDGFHTYEAVAKDFSDWLPKMSSRGVVLFHDINVREREFGVWRLWEEIAARYQTFAFVHSHGLGVAYLGSESPPAPIRALLAASDPDTIGRMRAYFARLGTSLVDRFGRYRAESAAGRVQASEAELEAARAENRQNLAAAETFRVEVGKQVSGLENALAAASAESARRVEVIARLEQELSTSRDETARQAEATASLHQELCASQAETGRQAEAAARLQQELFTSQALAARQMEAAARFEQELSASRAETAQRTDAAALLEQHYAEARSEVARLTDAASIGQMDAEQATNRIAHLEDELAAVRSEIVRQLEAADAPLMTTDDLGEQVAALGEELQRARGRMSEAIAQRERATHLLRRQIAATTGLQRELTGLTGRLDDLTTEHAAEVKRSSVLALSNHEIRQELDLAQQELHRVHAAIAATLAQPRYVVADRFNALARKAAFFHAPLKRVWAARSRGR